MAEKSAAPAIAATLPPSSLVATDGAAAQRDSESWHIMRIAGYAAALREQMQKNKTGRNACLLT